jgi:hypothetical protein
VALLILFVVTASLWNSPRFFIAGVVSRCEKKSGAFAAGGEVKQWTKQGIRDRCIGTTLLSHSPIQE